MRLDNKTIRSIAVGAVRAEETDNGIRFYKCTPGQIEAFRTVSEAVGFNATGSTGVRLDFVTNSRHFGFGAPAGKKFELAVNGILRAQYLMEEYRERGEDISVDLCDLIGEPISPVRITLYFPNHGQGGVLSFVELDDGATVERWKYDSRLLFIGDSITQGWNSKYDSLSFAYRLSSMMNAESVIQGIGGATFIPSTFDHIDFKPDRVIVALGTNDFGTSKKLDDMRADISGHLGLIADEYKGVPIYVITPIWRDRCGERLGAFRECRALIAAEARKLGLNVIDGFDLVPPFPELFADGFLHPNDLGFSIYAENLYRILLEKSPQNRKEST